ncbi:uncharacterized protein LOC119337891 isoform X2 [Triticum dicoccoides]|uniref:uncharacterized protein LOC119337891 isoform X2 n=1 Tax=Triticum dicoccoides TaxID=85692 RepID=UPI0018915988|nr:uncharacterized protein LOC119337891 isoform X2 [Triticum dicoccoides]
MHLTHLGRTFQGPSFSIWSPLLVDYGRLLKSIYAPLNVGGLAKGVSAADLEVVFGSIGCVAGVEFVRTSGCSFAYIDFHCLSHEVMTKLFSTLLWVLIVPLSQFIGMAIQEGTSSCGWTIGLLTKPSELILTIHRYCNLMVGVSPQKCKLQSYHFTILEVWLENLRMSEFQHFKS